MPRRRSSSMSTRSKAPSTGAPAKADAAPRVPISPELRKQRRRQVMVILAVLGIMLMSMGVGVYMYASDPDGWKTVFPAGAQVTNERPTDAVNVIPSHLRFVEAWSPFPSAVVGTGAASPSM